ncbi:MAG: sugar-binding protein [Victivallaceae bacterium]|nr:sugar-binding protein [Victivallaceae bacterium]
MKNLFIFMLFLGLVSPMSAKPNAAYEIYLAPKTETAPRLDGVFTDACWRKAPTINKFVYHPMSGQGLASVQTEVKICYDKDNLYIAVSCKVDDMKNLIATKAPKDCREIFKRDDTFEMFISSFSDNKSYYQLVTNAVGTQFDALNGVPSWNADWKAALKHNDKSWDAEIVIPFKAITSAAVADGDTFRIDLCRSVSSTATFTIWSDKSRPYHRPHNFNLLVLGDYRPSLLKKLYSSVEQYNTEAKNLLLKYPQAEWGKKYQDLSKIFEQLRNDIRAGNIKDSAQYFNTVSRIEDMAGNYKTFIKEFQVFILLS